MASIEVKIKKLDGELARYKEQMSRLRNGPGKVRISLPPALVVVHTSRNGWIPTRLFPLFILPLCPAV